MKKFTKRTLLCSALIVCGCFATQISTKEAAADAVIKSQQGVVVKTASFATNNVIKVPKKVETTTKKVTSNSASRGATGIGTTSKNAGVVPYALNFVGCAYVWGAEGPRAFDCSGFTKYIYKQFGVSLPHYSGSQFGEGRAVSRSELSAGDLVFFNTEGSISHVGIYIGGGKFVHAANSRTGVIVSSLSEGYYYNRFAGARRVK